MHIEHASITLLEGGDSQAAEPAGGGNACQKAVAGLLLALSLFSGAVLAEEADRDGIVRDLGYLMGYQAIGTGLIYYAPESVSNWSEEEKDELGFRQWRRNIGHPHWDKDHWAMNYVLHPYWGAAYYIRGRERGYSKAGSFWISAAFSTLYEFGFESFLEQPSWQDLFVTPLAGSALGLYFENLRQEIKQSEEPRSRMDIFILGATDPLGTLNGFVNSWLGIEEQDQPRSVMRLRALRESEAGSSGRQKPSVDGFVLTYQRRW